MPTVPWLTQDQVQNFGLWLQSGAIFLTFIGVIISASVNRRIARRRATLDLIMGEQSTEPLLSIRQKFIAMRDGGGLVQWADLSKAASNETSTIRSTLNRYELVAIGIKEKTLDKRVYKEYARTTVVRDWIALKPFVMERRRTISTPTIYCEVEWLAKKWANSDEKKHC